MGFKKFSAQRLINQYKFTRNRTSASGRLPMPNLPYHPILHGRRRRRTKKLSNCACHGHGNPSARRAVAVSGINIRTIQDCVPRPGAISCPVLPATHPTGKGNIRRSATVADNACCGGAGVDRVAARSAERIGLGALLRNGGRPGAKLFKALLRNAFAPFLRGWRGNARKDDEPPSFSFFSSPKGNLPVRFRPETYGALPAAFASFPDFWRRMDWRRR